MLCVWKFEYALISILSRSSSSKDLEFAMSVDVSVSGVQGSNGRYVGSKNEVIDASDGRNTEVKRKWS